MNILISQIDPDPDQPRRQFEPSKLGQLKKSIRQNGILAPLLLESNYKKNRYLILDGERRFRCATELKLKNVPAVIVQGPLSTEQRTIQRFNIQEQHQSWSLFDKARAIYQFKKESNLTLAEVGDKLNLQASQVYHWLSIIELSSRSQQLVLTKQIPFSYLLNLVRIIKHYQVITELTKEEIEIKLINKIDKGEITTATEISKLAKFMNLHVEIEEKTKFLLSTDYDVQQLFKKTKTGTDIYFEAVFTTCAKLKNSLLIMQTQKYKLTANQSTQLNELYTELKKILAA